MKTSNNIVSWKYNKTRLHKCYYTPKGCVCVCVLRSTKQKIHLFNNNKRKKGSRNKLMCLCSNKRSSPHTTPLSKKTATCKKPWWHCVVARSIMVCRSTSSSTQMDKQQFFQVCQKPCTTIDQRSEGGPCWHLRIVIKGHFGKGEKEKKK